MSTSTYNLWPLKPVIQPYAWGSHEYMARLLGEPIPSPEPQAEMWMGAHPKAPSRIQSATGEEALDVAVAAAPTAVLGAATASRFAGKLPFLLKLLAAGEPLSIQSHPSLAQAAEGYARENAAGIPLDAPHRNYRDDNHKPEIICALTPFWALSGFRAATEIAALWGRVPGMEAHVARLQRDGWQAAFEVLMRLDVATRAELAAAAAAVADEAPEWRWVRRLQDVYPGDIGVLAPLYLNVVELAPGEALFQDAGTLHAYLDGLGVELMANSDNVLRGGCTVKHVDVPELLKTLDFSAHMVHILRPEPVGNGEGRYLTPAPEFALSVLDIGPQSYHAAAERPVELLVCVAGRVTVRSDATEVTLTPGQSLLAPAALGRYTVTGTGRLYKATVTG